MKALVTGADGQLGIALRRFAAAETELVACGRKELDIADRTAVERALDARCDVLINAAAYTDVEGAEREPREAFRVNSGGAAILAAACAARDIHLIHVSTDFVFDGTKGAPYAPADAPRPLNVYGASKLEGEQRVLAAAANACIVRTSWVHGPDRSNFVTKFLQRMRTGAALRVVTDEVGAPTSVHSLARALWRCAARGIRGLQHWSDAGSTNRFEYARAIGTLALEYQLISELPHIDPARAADFATGAKRPAYSILSTKDTELALDMRAQPWIEGLRLTMQDIRSHEARR